MFHVKHYFFVKKVKITSVIGKKYKIMVYYLYLEVRWFDV